MIREDLYELPFDQFQRYKAVHDFVDAVRAGSQAKLKVLDVGGYPGLIADFLPDDDVTIVDVLPDNMPNYVQAGGEKLPFEPGSFDLVCSCDALEHVPAEDRPSFIAELVRVSKDFVLITAPFSDQRTRMAEEILFNYVWKVLRAEFTTLKEHLDNGLPDLGQTLEWLRDVGAESASFPSGYLYHWLPMMVAKHHLMAHPDTAELHRKVDLFYNLNFSDDDNRQPSYRRVVIGSKSGDKRAGEFCARFSAVGYDGAAPAVDMAKLQMFRMLTDVLDVELKRDVGALVDHFKGSLSQELETANRKLVERDRQVEDLKAVIKAQNDSLDDLYALVSKVRNFWPYRVYSNLRRRRSPK